MFVSIFPLHRGSIWLRYCLTPLFLFISLTCHADGWPANYGGVMIQGFFWENSPNEDKWVNLTSQAAEMGPYFDLIWVPNSGNCISTNTMGYAPVYWFNHNSAFGTLQELKTMIAAFHAQGMGVIEDVVINHKNGYMTWAQFAQEEWNGHNITWSLADICRDDEYNSASGAASERSQYGSATGANDSGERYESFRDLDHTSANVRQNVKWYLEFLLDTEHGGLGYDGFRYDMVVGYAGKYTGEYNATVRPQFSVGEYWKRTKNEVVNWINSTKEYNGEIQSAAFDFPLKHQTINNAFQNSNFTLSAFANKGLTTDATMNRYSVTFVDNHDTDRDDNKLTQNILGANAYILAMPGTPCVFISHWKTYKEEIKKMILARKEAGITNQSSIVEEGQDTDGSGYYMIVQGESKKIMFVAGNYASLNTFGYRPVSKASSEYAFYIEDPTYIADDSDIDENPGYDPVKTITIFVTTKNNTAPYLFVWQDSNRPNGNFPGTQMTEEVTGIDGTHWWKQTFTGYNSISAIFSVGSNTHQTGNINNINSDIYYLYDTTVPSKNTNAAKNLTDTHQSVDKAYYCYAEVRPASWGDNCYVYAWNGGTEIEGAWPGSSANVSLSGYTSDGYPVYKWNTNSATAPASIIFNNPGATTYQTVDLTFSNGGYYVVSTTVSSTDDSTTKYNTQKRTAAIPTNATLFSRSFTAGNRATVCLPFNLNTEEVESIEGRFYAFMEESNGLLVFNRVGSITAFQPYLFVGKTDGTLLNSLYRKLLISNTGSSVSNGNFTFTGTTVETPLVSDSHTTYYGYSGNNFVKVGSGNGAKSGAYRSYFSTTAALAPVAVQLNDNSTTGITFTEDAQFGTKGALSNAVYTLDGRKILSDSSQLSLRTLPKGIYIFQGKKMVVK